MKTLVISIPAMGKTTLVKTHRSASWSNSCGVDFDLKGHNSHDVATRAAQTSLVNGLFSQGHTFVTGFNGSFLFHLINQPVHVVFVAPTSKEAMEATVMRSYMRGDSFKFNASLATNIKDWVTGLMTAYSQALSDSRCKEIGHKFTFVSIQDSNTTIPDLFTFDQDSGELLLNQPNEVLGTISLGTEFQLYSGYLKSAYTLGRENFHAMCASLGENFAEVERLLNFNMDAIYRENLLPDWSSDPNLQVVTILCDSSTDLKERFTQVLEAVPDFRSSDVRFSFDLHEHSTGRARISFTEYDETSDDGRLYVRPYNWNYFFYVK